MWWYTAWWYTTWFVYVLKVVQFNVELLSCRSSSPATNTFDPNFFDHKVSFVDVVPYHDVEIS